MSYPNVPLGNTPWQRQISQATNHLLNQINYFQFVVEGQPADGETIIKTQFPIPVTLIASECSGWAGTASSGTAVVNYAIGGVSAGTTTFSAGNQDAPTSLTTVLIPAFTDFEITAPTPQDATLADVTLTLVANL